MAKWHGISNVLTILVMLRYFVPDGHFGCIMVIVNVMAKLLLWLIKLPGVLAAIAVLISAAALVDKCRCDLQREG